MQAGGAHAPEREAWLGRPDRVLANSFSGRATNEGVIRGVVESMTLHSKDYWFTWPPLRTGVFAPQFG